MFSENTVFINKKSVIFVYLIYHRIHVSTLNISKKKKLLNVIFTQEYKYQTIQSKIFKYYYLHYSFQSSLLCNFFF